MLNRSHWLVGVCVFGLGFSSPVSLSPDGRGDPGKEERVAALGARSDSFAPSGRSWRGARRLRLSVHGRFTNAPAPRHRRIPLAFKISPSGGGAEKTTKNGRRLSVFSGIEAVNSIAIDDIRKDVTPYDLAGTNARRVAAELNGDPRPRPAVVLSTPSTARPARRCQQSPRVWTAAGVVWFSRIEVFSKEQ